MPIFNEGSKIIGNMIGCPGIKNPKGEILTMLLEYWEFKAKEELVTKLVMILGVNLAC